MGWKSTEYITRESAIRLVLDVLIKVHNLPNNQIEDFLEKLGYGDDTNLPYYGRNFRITTQEEVDNHNEEEY